MFGYQYPDILGQVSFEKFQLGHEVPSNGPLSSPLLQRMVERQNPHPNAEEVQSEHLSTTSLKESI
jgi:hypothetical protein